MKIAVSSYSFSQAMRAGRMNILDVIPKAKEMGYEGVEIVRGNQSDAEMRALAVMLKAQAAEAGIPIIAYMVTADFAKRPLEEQVDMLKAEAEIAALMGASRMRHDTSYGKDAEGNEIDFEKTLPVIAEGCRRVAEFAAGLGVQTMTENHGRFMQDALRVKKLMESVDHPNFGWLIDMGNFSGVDEVCVESVRIAAPMAVHVHAKDVHIKNGGGFKPLQGWGVTRGGNYIRGAMIGHGDVNVKECLKILKEAGYDGWLSVEFEGMEDCIMALKANIENLKEMFAALGI